MAILASYMAWYLGDGTGHDGNMYCTSDAEVLLEGMLAALYLCEFVLMALVDCILGLSLSCHVPQFLIWS